MSIRVVQSSIRIMPNGEVVIAEQDMNAGTVHIIPLVVKDGKIYAKDGDGE